MGYVYKITNTVNGKAYIGISIHEPEKRRIKAHLSGHGNRIIARAVKKYGKDAFTHEILEANVFDEFLPDLEVAYIANHNTVAPHGYNLNSGGDHAIPSEDTRRKMSESLKGKTMSADARRKLSEANMGKSHTESTRRKMSEARKGEKNNFYGKRHSEKARRKMSEAAKGRTSPNRGKILSMEQRREISERQKGIKRPPFSSEHRQKLSKAAKGKRLSSEHRRKLSEAKLSPEYASAHDFFLSLPADMPLKAKRKLLYTKFPNVHKGAIQRWVRKWTNWKSPPEYTSAHDFFLSLPADMPLREKRKLLYNKFSNVPERTIRKWVQKWTS